MDRSGPKGTSTRSEGHKRKIQISEERDRLKSEPFTGDCFGGGGD